MQRNSLMQYSARQVALLAALAPLASACGSVSAEPPHADAGADHATVTTVTPDAGRADVSAPPKDASVVDVVTRESDAGHDAPGEAATPPVGTLLDVGVDHVIYGLTNDGYVVYQSNSAIYAIQTAAGSKPILLAGSTNPDAGADAGALGYAVAYVLNDVVLVWTQLNENYVGALTVWSSSMAAPKLLAGASTVEGVAASDDSKYLVYTGNSNSTGSIVGLYGITLADGSAPVTLASSIEATMACGFQPAISGTHAIVQYCPVNDAGGASPPGIYSFTTGTWAAELIASETTEFQPDTAGTDIAFTTTAGALDVGAVDVSEGGAAPVQIDTAVGIFYLSLTDKFVLYNTTTGGLRVAPLPFAGPPTSLQTANINGLYAVSPDEKWVLTYNQVDSTTGYPSDVSLASTSTTAAPSLLTSGSATYTYGGSPVMNAFTRDGSHFVYLSNIAFNANYEITGALLSSATTAASSISAPLTKQVAWQWSMLAGAKILYSDNYVFDEGVAGRADLYLVDLATSAPSTLLQASADAYSAVSSDGTKLVYSIDTSATTNALYVYSL